MMTPSDHQAGEAKGFFPKTTTDSTDAGANNTSHHRTAHEDRAARSQPSSEAEPDHSTQVCATETGTRTKTGTEIESESGSENDDSGGGNADPNPDNLDDDDEALLPKNYCKTVVYHATAPADDNDETDRTLCNKVGSYRRVSVTQAREEADRYCRACAAKQDGTDRRPCPTCGRLIGVTYWPQHVGQCTGTPNHPNRSPTTDSNSGSDTDATTGERRT